jgi:hypothetical protein
MRGMTEHELVQSILLEFGSRPTLRLWRHNVGAATYRGKDGARGGLVRFGQAGQADIMGLIAPSGRFLAVECKTATGRQSDAQRNWQAMVERFGGLYILARSIDDVRRALP